MTDSNERDDGSLRSDDEELVQLREGLRRSIVETSSSAKAQKAAKPVVSTHPVELTTSTFEPFVQQHDRVVIDVWAPWCGPCRYLSPIVDQLAGEMASRVAFGKINSDEEPSVAMEYGVQGIPTLLLFKGGKLAGRLVGAMPKEALEARLKGPLSL